MRTPSLCGAAEAAGGAGGEVWREENWVWRSAGGEAEAEVGENDGLREPRAGGEEEREGE